MNGGGWKYPFHAVRRILAKGWFSLYPRLTVIGVTGSYGKTNTTRAIAYVLGGKYRCLTTDLNLDTVYNLPITLLKVRPWHQKLILELGVDHRGEMDSHLSLVRPEIAVLTGITPVHSDPELLGSVGGIMKEKGKLLSALPTDGLAILNWDDEKVRMMAKSVKRKMWRYGLENQNADFIAKNIKVDYKGTSFDFIAKDNCCRRSFPMFTGLIGRHFVQDCLAAIAVGLNQGLTLAQIKRGLEKLKPLPGRLSLEPGFRETLLLNDCLRANPASTIAGLRTLAELPAKGRRIAILGEMGELGESREKEHQRIGEEVARLHLDFLVGIGPLQKLTTQAAIKSGMANERVFWGEDVRAATGYLRKILKKGDLWYLKGSLLRHLERIILLLNENPVGCQVVSCRFYHQCSVCPYLQSGPPNV